MSAKIKTLAMVTVLMAAPAFADGFGKGQAAPGTQSGAQTGALTAGQSSHDVVKGDTMWDLSGKYWSNKFSWPKMWSYNPQVRNPHWIFPGQKLFLSEPDQAAQGENVREVQLTVEKLVPEKMAEVAKAPASGEAKKAAEEKAAQAAEDKKKASVKVVPDRAQDYLAVERPARLGTLGNEQATKLFTAKNEEMEFRPASSGAVKVGDRLTIFDDTREITHPTTGAVIGRQVKVLGDMVVTRIGENTAWGRVLTSYDVIEDGFGLMAYREPITYVEKASSGSKVDGVVLAGKQEMTLFTNEDAIFLDKGKDDGIVVGSIVNLAYPVGPFAAEGYTENLDRPMARAIILSAQSKTSTAWVLDSAKAVEAGFRFVASADSP